MRRAASLAPMNGADAFPQRERALAQLGGDRSVHETSRSRSTVSLRMLRSCVARVVPFSSSMASIWVASPASFSTSSFCRSSAACEDRAAAAAEAADRPEGPAGQRALLVPTGTCSRAVRTSGQNCAFLVAGQRVQVNCTHLVIERSAPCSSSDSWSPELGEVSSMRGVYCPHRRQRCHEPAESSSEVLGGEHKELLRASAAAAGRSGGNS